MMLIFNLKVYTLCLFSGQGYPEGTRQRLLL